MIAFCVLAAVLTLIGMSHECFASLLDPTKMSTERAVQNIAVVTTMPDVLLAWYFLHLSFSHCRQASTFAYTSYLCKAEYLVIYTSQV